MIYELTTLFRETVDKPIWEVEKDLKEFETKMLFKGKSLKDIIEIYEYYKKHTQIIIDMYYSKIAKESLSDIDMAFIKRNYNHEIMIALNNRLLNLKDVWDMIDTEKVTYKNVLKELREMTLNELVDMKTKTTSLISIKEVISLTYSREEVEEVTLLPLAKEIYLRYSNILEHNNKIQLFDNIGKEFKEIERLKLSRGERYKETFDEMYEKLGFKSCLSMLYIKTDRAINLENQLLERYDYVRDIEDIDGEDRDIIDNLIDSVLDFINYAVMLEVLIRGGSNKNN